MTAQYLTARDALIRELEAAEAALGGAEGVYKKADVQHQQARDTANRAYDAMKKIEANVDRLTRALKIIEGDES